MGDKSPKSKMKHQKQKDSNKAREAQKALMERNAIAFNTANRKIKTGI